MSNEYKDWLADRKAEDAWWIEHYPFLKIKDNSICPWNSTDSCWLREIPSGWVKAFGKQMCDELMAVLGVHADEWTILQMKEKYSHLVIYWAWEDCHTSGEDDDFEKLYHDIEEILSKYYDLSYRTCWTCGAQATKFTKTGLIASYCKECFEKGLF